MTQTERLDTLIGLLLKEQSRYAGIKVPDTPEEKKLLLRSLWNLRPPMPAEKTFLDIQDEYLKEELNNRGITRLQDLTPIQDHLYLWQGDITALECGAIVNAANSQMLGCFVPCHGCIDNAIHTYAGVQLRLACYGLMKEQGAPEPTGRAKITPAFNLPSSFVLHTVGPVISGALTSRDCETLASCYRSCLSLAEQRGISSVAFCCISTGEFHFPNDRAAEIAVQTVKAYLQASGSDLSVLFNVFKDEDYSHYKRLLS